MPPLNSKIYDGRTRAGRSSTSRVVDRDVAVLLRTSGLEGQQGPGTQSFTTRPIGPRSILPQKIKLNRTGHSQQTNRSGPFLPLDCKIPTVDMTTHKAGALFIVDHAPAWYPLTASEAFCGNDRVSTVSPVSPVVDRPLWNTPDATFLRWKWD
jgi:hypothetical protein